MSNYIAIMLHCPFPLPLQRYYNVNLRSLKYEFALINTAIHISKMITPQLLKDWEEEKMLNLIHWLNFNSNSIKEALPGIEIREKHCLIKSSLETELSKYKNDLIIENRELDKAERWKIGRIPEMRKLDISRQQKKCEPLVKRINEITFELTERFMQI